MLNTSVFGDLLSQHGFNFYSGVPCSFLQSLINYASSTQRYVAAVNEGDAVASCAGASIAGAKSVVLMQNSGLTNATSPLTSLNFPFRIPVLGFVSLRGEPGLKDEPQHELMGTITGSLLTTMNIEWAYLSSDIEIMLHQVKFANSVIESGQSFFFVVKKGTFDHYALNQIEMPRRLPGVVSRSPLTANLLRRSEVLQFISDLRDEKTVLFATTGVTGRELYQLADHERNFYMIGSMGCVSPLALGFSLRRPDLNVVAIDGDGALLMRMGNLASMAYYRPANLLHLLLDNGVHESTGGQATASPNVDFAQVAVACGYAAAFDVNTLDDLQQAISQWKRKGELTFIRMRIQNGHLDPLVRANEKPTELLARLQRSINIGDKL